MESSLPLILVNISILFHLKMLLPCKEYPSSSVNAAWQEKPAKRAWKVTIKNGDILEFATYRKVPSQVYINLEVHFLSKSPGTLASGNPLVDTYWMKYS